MPTTSINALRYPASSAAPNVPQDIQNLASDVDNKIVPRFSTTTARDSAIPSPVAGQMAMVAGKPYLYNGGWKGLSKATAGAIQAVTLNASGDINIAHGLGLTPTFVTLSLVGTVGAAQYGVAKSYQAPDATNIFVRCTDGRDGTGLANFGVTISWGAFVL